MATTFLSKANNAVSSLASGITSGGLSIVVATGQGAKFPSSGQFICVLWDNTTYPNAPSSDPNLEIVLIDSRSSDTLTVNASGRGYEGTTAAAHATGIAIAQVLSKAQMTEYETAINNIELGWITPSQTLTYSSVDDPTGVVTTSADMTAIISVGMRIKFTNNSQTVNGIVTAITASAITFLHEIDPATSQALHLMQNSAITNFRFSHMKAPFGFPLAKSKWRIVVENTSDLTQVNPTNGTWYNATSIIIPIGEWTVDYRARLLSANTSGTDIRALATLSTANNSESDATWTTSNQLVAGSASISLRSTVYAVDEMTVATKTTHYLNYSVGTTGHTLAGLQGTISPTLIRATCAYL